MVAAANAYTPLNAIFSADDPTGSQGGARVRVVHASPDAPAVDVWVDGSIVFSNMAFEEITDFVEVPAGTYNVQVVPAGATEPVVIAGDFDLAAATDYTVIATDFLAMLSPVVLTADGGTPAEGKAWVRFFHGSPDAPAVDIAVAGEGPVLFSNVSFQEGTAYLPVDAGTYDLEARLAGTGTVALSIPGVAVEDGGVYTAYATGLAADVGALANFYFVPGAIKGDGARGSSYLTDVDIHNAGQGTAFFRYLWLPRGVDNSDPAASDVFSVGPGEVLRHRDVLGAAFGVGMGGKDGHEASGALALIADSEQLMVSARIFNQSGTGSYGQALPGLAAGDLVPANVRKRILSFNEGPMFRSNIGILNGTGSPMTIRWQRYTPDGTMVDDGSAELPPWGNVQLNRVFRGERPVAGGYIDVWTETDGAAFTAYGSMLDNATSDPTTLFMKDLPSIEMGR